MIIPEERAAPSRQSRAIARILRLGVRPIANQMRGNALSIRTVRTALDAAARLLRVDPRVRVEQLYDPQIHRSGTPVRAEWVHRVEDQVPESAILYLHGGGYVLCSPQTHRPITSRLALDTGVPVLVPHYRLAPEHPFPAALNDALAAYQWLLAHGIPASRIVVAGDSAGGHLAASLVAEIGRTGLPSPAAAILFSPWVDLSCELSLEWDKWIADPYISPAMARRVSRLVVGTAEFTDPRLALLDCPWTAAAPPFLIQVGGAEVLRPEAEKLAGLLNAAGVPCELQVWPGQMHVFQILNRFLPESSAAMRETSQFIAAALSKAQQVTAVA
jgi:acetyl esterase/lipase